MMSKNDDFRSQVLSLVQDPGFLHEAAQIQAKALLNKIAEEVPPYRWSYIARRVVRNATMASFWLDTIAEKRPDEIDSLSNTARTFALIWESLAQLREATSRETALLNAAVNYELAGYQANAACIAKQLNHSSAQTDRPTLIEMGSLFLQRCFLQLYSLSQKVQVEPTTNGGLNISLIAAMGHALAGKAFSQAIHSLSFGLLRSRPWEKGSLPPLPIKSLRCLQALERQGLLNSQ